MPYRVAIYTYEGHTPEIRRSESPKLDCQRILAKAQPNEGRNRATFLNFPIEIADNFSIRYTVTT